jgi:hypothetical protein
MSRSLLPITLDDLRRLGAIAAADRAQFFARHPDTATLYSDRLFAVALCQGAALHYLDGKNGIKDLDVWSFYREHTSRMFPPRRRAKADFDDPKFGTSPDFEHYVGRRVDLIGRSIRTDDGSDPIEILRAYLRQKKTTSAKLLAQKAMILIEPGHLLGAVVWPA